MYNQDYDFINTLVCSEMYTKDLMGKFFLVELIKAALDADTAAAELLLSDFQ